ncbi:flavin reductase family protein [Roseinatronobacter sp. NSM]|uniref:flavin reductase family protein n=1 Tax=Roseinatronobacter sp. NSM TaxID=3457785 RepID=UPI004035CC4B
MRLVASSVSLVTACDDAGEWHGMAVTSAGSLSMSPPSMMVAVNRTASIHPVIMRSGRFTINLMDESHAALLEPFARSDMRDRRFEVDDWVEAGSSGPVLKGALCSHVCSVSETHDFGTHTVFFGTVDDVILPQDIARSPAPILWLNGRRVSVATPQTI